MKEKVKSFEDLIAWQKARELTKEIYRQTRQGTFSHDYGLSNQIQRASVSIMSNLTEGFKEAAAPNSISLWLLQKHPAPK